MFSVHTTSGEFKNTICHSEFVFKENSVREPQDYRDALVFEKLRFRDGLVWTVGLTVEIKLRFQIPPAFLSY